MHAEVESFLSVNFVQIFSEFQNQNPISEAIQLYRKHNVTSLM